MLNSFQILNGINGNIKIPGDKSISHRSIIIPSIAKGCCQITNLLMSDDVLKTIKAFTTMGVKIDTFEDKIIINGCGLNSLQKPSENIYLGNSGTGARLLTGLLASQNFNSIITGDESLSKRPMKRMTDPLKLMNAKFKDNKNLLPLSIYGKKLNPIEYEIPVPSAQVKSGIIFAALNTAGKTRIIEKNITRDHTEIMLEYFEANIEVKKNDNFNQIDIIGKKELNSKDISVPADLSSSAFFIVSALINKNSKILLENININPTRDGILRALKMMGGKIEILNKRTVNGEIIADLKAETSQLNGCNLDENMAHLMIDEYPILSVAAAFANSPSNFKGLRELKVKESDRLELIRINLERCGVDCKVNEDELFINPQNKTEIKNPEIKTDYDHRIAMSFAIMGSRIEKNLKIKDAESIKTSFPNFVELYNNAGGKLVVN